MKKFICTFLVFSIFLGISSNVFAHDNDIKIKNDSLKHLKPDTIVCYLDDVPVRASDIDEFGVISKSIINKATNKKQVTMRYAQAQSAMWDMTVPYQHRGKCVVVDSVLTSIRYSQDNTYFYLPNKYARPFADRFASGSIETIVFFASGFLPSPYNTIGACTALVKGLYGTSLENDINSLSDAGKNVEVRRVSSNYGTFWAVFEWNGTTIAGKSFTTNNSKYKVKKIAYS